MNDEIKFDKVDIDLDIILREKRSIKLNGKIIEVEIPDLETFFKLSKVSSDLKNIQEQTEKDGMTEDAAVEILEKFNKVFYELFPNLSDENLMLEQKLALINFVSKLAMPKDTTELQKHDVVLGDDQKKTDSESSEQSHTS